MENLPLPEFKPPKSLEEAVTEAAFLGRTRHEHAYRMGKLLSWVKDKTKFEYKPMKPRPKKGETFTAFIEKNFWFTPHYAATVIRYARECDHAGFLLPEYAPTVSAKKWAQKYQERVESLPQDIQKILSQYFPEAWIAAGQSHDRLIGQAEPRRVDALRKLSESLSRDQLALVYLGYYLASASAQKAA